MFVQTCFSTYYIVNKNKNCVFAPLHVQECRQGWVYKYIMCVHKGVKYEGQVNSESQMPSTLRLLISLLFVTMYIRRVGLWLSKDSVLCSLPPEEVLQLKMNSWHNSTWFWGFKLRSLHLHSKHFTYWAIFPPPMDTF